MKQHYYETTLCHFLFLQVRFGSRAQLEERTVGLQYYLMLSVASVICDLCVCYSAQIKIFTITEEKNNYITAPQKVQQYL